MSEVTDKLEELKVLAESGKLEAVVFITCEGGKQNMMVFGNIILILGMLTAAARHIGDLINSAFYKLSDTTKEPTP